MSGWTWFLFANPRVKLRLKKQNKKTHLGSMVSGNNSNNVKETTEDGQEPGKGA